ncbi:MAG: hypothetical protein KF874_06255 [Rhizobiaceae bacterium]|nr:hypothetical protein [Rhizobiaceae bacterium]
MTGCSKLNSAPSIRTMLAAAMLFAISGCTTPDDPSSQAKNTGNFPNLNIKPATAASQLTQDEADSAIASLKGAQAGQMATGRGAGATASEGELRRLGATHSEDALKAICAPRPSC